MVWDVGMSYEEMQRRYGGSGGGGADGGDDDDDEEAATDVAVSAPRRYASEPIAFPLPPTTPDSIAATTTASTTAIQEDPPVPPPVPPPPPPPPEDHPHIYHLCRRSDWETAVDAGNPYFPRTFLEDGRFTRASRYLDDVLDVANDFYRGSSPPDEEWIVLELDARYLYYGLGIPVEPEAAAAPAPAVPGTNDGAAENEEEEEGGGSAPPPEVQCLRIFGGLSTHPGVRASLLSSVYATKRRDVDGKFIGLTAAAAAAPSGVPDAGDGVEATAAAGGDGDAGGSGDGDGGGAKPPAAAATAKKKRGFFSKLKKGNKSTGGGGGGNAKR